MITETLPVVLTFFWERSVMSLSLLVSFFFFFSSRRRHTRYIGDWSSDVCSSDLGGANRSIDFQFAGTIAMKEVEQTVQQFNTRFGRRRARRRDHHFAARIHAQLRSEERRVGKECRYRGVTEH